MRALKDQAEDSAEPDPRRGKAVSPRLIHATDISRAEEPVDCGLTDVRVTMSVDSANWEAETPFPTVSNDSTWLLYILHSR